MGVGSTQHIISLRCVPSAMRWKLTMELRPSQFRSSVNRRTEHVSRIVAHVAVYVDVVKNSGDLTKKTNGTALTCYTIQKHPQKGCRIYRNMHVEWWQVRGLAPRAICISTRTSRARGLRQQVSCITARVKRRILAVCVAAPPFHFAEAKYNFLSRIGL